MLCVYDCVCCVCVCVGVYVCVWGNLFFNLILFLSSKVCTEHCSVEIDLIVYPNVADESLTAMCTQLMYNYSF